MNGQSRGLWLGSLIKARDRFYRSGAENSFPTGGNVYQPKNIFVLTKLEEFYIAGCLLCAI